MPAAKTKPIRLLLADDHEVVRLGLRSLLVRSGAIQVVGEAETATDAVKKAVRLKPDVVLMDVRLPEGGGVQACREIRASCPYTRVLFLSSYVDDEAAMATFVGGANGYLLKEIKKEALLSAIKAVAEGHSIQDPSVNERILKRMQAPSHPGAKGEEETLSPQEQKVLALVADGKTNKEIAFALTLSDKTVKNYLRNIFQKLQVTRRSQAVAKFTRRSTAQENGENR